MKLLLPLYIAMACAGCSSAPLKMAPAVAAVRSQNTQTRGHIKTSRERIEKSQLDESAADKKLQSVKDALDELLK